MVVEELLYKEVGIKLRACRKARRLSQINLAKQVGVERTSISNIELGNQKATLAFLYNVCIVLDVELGELIPSIKSVNSLANKVPNAVSEKTKSIIDKY